MDHNVMRDWQLHLREGWSVIVRKGGSGKKTQKIASKSIAGWRKRIYNVVSRRQNYVEQNTQLSSIKILGYQLHKYVIYSVDKFFVFLTLFILLLDIWFWEFRIRILFWISFTETVTLASSQSGTWSLRYLSPKFEDANADEAHAHSKSVQEVFEKREVEKREVEKWEVEKREVEKWEVEKREVENREISHSR